jgi:hypothetical protein
MIRLPDEIGQVREIGAGMQLQQERARRSLIPRFHLARSDEL